MMIGTSLSKLIQKMESLCFLSFSPLSLANKQFRKQNRVSFTYEELLLNESNQSLDYLLVIPSKSSLQLTIDYPHDLKEEEKQQISFYWILYDETKLSLTLKPNEDDEDDVILSSTPSSSTISSLLTIAQQVSDYFRYGQVILSSSSSSSSVPVLSRQDVTNVTSSEKVRGNEENSFDTVLSPLTSEPHLVRFLNEFPSLIDVEAKVRVYPSSLLTLQPIPQPKKLEPVETILQLTDHNVHSGETEQKDTAPSSMLFRVNVYQKIEVSLNFHYLLSSFYREVPALKSKNTKKKFIPPKLEVLLVLADIYSVHRSKTLTKAKNSDFSQPLHRKEASDQHKKKIQEEGFTIPPFSSKYSGSFPFIIQGKLHCQYTLSTKADQQESDFSSLSHSLRINFLKPSKYCLYVYFRLIDENGKAIDSELLNDEQKKVTLGSKRDTSSKSTGIATEKQIDKDDADASPLWWCCQSPVSFVVS
jgi:hypothetical protein